MLRFIHLLTILYAVILTLLLELPSVPQDIDPVPAPLAIYKHLIAFTVLGILVELGRCRKSMLFWMCVLILYAIGTEILQGLLHQICNRFFGWEDIVLNILGILLGTFIGHFCRLFVKRPSETLDKMG